MSDIMKFIRHPASNRNDPDGNLLALPPWSEDAAEARARELGVALNNDHWDVVLFVRDYYRGHGENTEARALLDALCDEFASAGGRRYLYKLFPAGPVVQAAYIAGIPEPKGARDNSFGSVH